MRLLVAGVVLALLASVLPGQPVNVRFHQGTVVIPTNWMGGPAFLVAARGGSNRAIVEFQLPYGGMLDVALNIQIWGAMDSRWWCVDQFNPMLVGYAIGDDIWPQNVFTGGVNLWFPDGGHTRRTLSHADCQGLPFCDMNVGVCNPGGTCFSYCPNGSGPEIVFFVVTASLR